jgi:hypothetical protein
MLLKCATTVAFTCSLSSWCKMSPAPEESSFQVSSLVGDNNNIIVIIFTYTCRWPTLRKLSVLRTTSCSDLTANPSSEKSIDVWEKENPYSGISSATSHVNRLRLCPFTPIGGAGRDFTFSEDEGRRYFL